MTADALRTAARGPWPDGRHRRLALGKALEAELGDPWASGHFGFRAALDRDEREQEPSEAYKALLGTGFVAWTVPSDHGGQAVDVDETFLLARLLARRDATLAVAALATTVGFMPIWVAGTPEQRAKYGSRVLAGERFGFALSEREHGSDVLANETMATQDVTGGWVVRGAKQGIGNAAFARWFTVVARTGSRPGPASLSVIVVDADDPRSPGAVRHDRTWRLQGLRGFALGDLTFDGATAPAEAVVGGEGRGLETIMRSTQVARSLITAIPLGGADASLRSAMDFASWRTLFGAPLRDAPYTRAQLAECFARLIYVESANTVAIRGLQALPDQAAVLSSAVKYTVPRRAAEILDVLTDVLGARHYDRDHPRLGTHAKNVRDVRVAHFADGNAVVNLKVVAASLATLLPTDEDLLSAHRSAAEVLVDIAAPTAPLPPFEPDQQAITPRDAGVAAAALASAAQRLDQLRSDGGRIGELAGRALEDIAIIWENGREARRRTAEGRSRTAHAPTAALQQLRLAEVGCTVVLAGCAAAAWEAAPRSLGDSEGTLAVFVLGVALEAGTADTLDHDVHEAAFSVLDALHRGRCLFSTLPVELAPDDQAPPWT